MNNRLLLALLLLCVAGLVAACRPITAPPPATLDVTFAIANGTTGFAATIYAQEVDSGATTTKLYAAYSDPITMTVAAPGTYVLYARLVEAPDEYHYGMAACADGAVSCERRVLTAIDVAPGERYAVTIDDRTPLLPERDLPVTVPWQSAPEE